MTKADIEVVVLNVWLRTKILSVYRVVPEATLAVAIVAPTP
jgi:hypothetical protein